ncbi:hypothetical protein VNI00_011169 [Paramarasmius palmivorus]|uniref:SHSP domain-containing protein n=1 Tax=Paramarasmius palmivorus TaxID=297713 RepID=A0AAW0CH84_9AGAR
MEAKRDRTDIFEPLFSDILVAQLEVPGVRAEDCRINVVNGFLVIEGERRIRYQCCDLSSGKWKHKANGANDCDFVGVGQVLNELRYGSWQKRFKMPDGVGPEHIKTRLENGILHVQWPGSSPKVLVEPEA